MPTKVKGRMDLADALLAMGKDYRADPVKAVRSQAFINHLHDYLRDDLESRLTRWARRSRGVYVKKEAKLLAWPRTRTWTWLSSIRRTGRF